MNKAEKIFKSYNDMIEKFYNSILENKDTREALHANSSSIDDMLEANKVEWENRIIGTIGDISPSEYFNSLTAAKDIIDAFKAGASITEGNMPELFLRRLDDFKLSLTKEILDIAVDINMMKDKELYYVPLMAIRVLGRWQAAESAEPLIELITGGNVDDELFIESAANTVVQIGRPVVELILHKLESVESVKESDKYLMSALTKICKSSKDDRVYTCLKNLFLKMNDKELGAAYLGEYGDGRAVTALRGYLLKNNGNIGRAELYEIKSAIQKLGGNIDDLQIAFR